jgi:hypothetical protein
MIPKIDAILAIVGPDKHFGLTVNGVLEWYESSDEGKPTEEQIQAQIAELEAAEPMRLLRLERTRLLAESDWMANSDVTMTEEWRVYRQALRDITTQTPSLDNQGNLTGITWPTPPND